MKIQFPQLIYLVTFGIFLTLKLLGEITWSWWWVTAPVWIPCIIAATAIVIFLFIKEYKKGKKL